MPNLTIIIPTYDRSRLVGRAVDSALAQTAANVEVLVVDDASPSAPALPSDPRVRAIRLTCRRGHAAARNAGIEICTTDWLTFLDDDDELLPDMVEVSMRAIESSRLPPPVAALSGIECVDPDGRVRDTRLPPTLPRGACFVLEPEQPGRSFLTKQTLVVRRDVLRSIGGFDEQQRSRVHTELFLRLNPVCSLEGIARVTYRRHLHDAPRIFGDSELRESSFRRLVEKHGRLLRSRPEGYARLLIEHARLLHRAGRSAAALRAVLVALRYAPFSIVSRVFGRRPSAAGRSAAHRLRA